MSYRTLAEVETEIRFRFDLEGFTSRHPQTNVFRLINDVYRDLRDRLTSEGSTLFISSTEATQSTTGRTSGYPGTLLTAATFPSFSIVHEVHCLIGSSWVPLAHRSLADALTETDNSSTGVPMAWCLAGVNAESGSSTGQQLQLLITPALDVARTFRVLGLKSWTYLTQTTDRIYTDLGLDGYIMAAVGVILVARDDDVELYQARVAERELAYQEIKKRSKRRDPAPMRRVDVRSRRVR